MNKLKDIIRHEGRTQKWLSEKLNVSENTISSWVNNKSQPSLKMIYSIAEAMNVKASDLLIEPKIEERK